MEKKELVQKIDEVLNRIRPSLRMDGGGIDLIDVDTQSGVVKVKMKGACVGCPMSQITLKMGVEAVLKESFPFITQVIAQ